MNTPPAAHSKPGIIGWTAAAFSACLIVYLIGAVLQVGEYWRKTVCAERAKLALDGSNMALARYYTDRALRAEGLAWLFSLGSNIDTKLGNLIALNLDLLEESNGYDFRAALNRIEILRTSISEVQVLDPDEPRLVKTADDAKPVLESLVYLDNKRRTKQAERGRLEEQRRKLVQAYSIIATEFGEFFSLTPEKADPESALPVYEKGVLKGLPRLQNLEDDLPTLTALAKSLEIARGKVQLEPGANAHLQFTERMKYFRNAMRPLNLGNSTVTKAIIEIDSYLAANESELKRSRYVLDSNLREIFFTALAASRTPSPRALAEIGDSLRTVIL
ncbi:MAG: hypothetical protein J5J00_08695 [Deltaproteobacteria bacterium]|nr:hypothetical protein [Deltaproteobacteria bacterium]